MRTNTHTRIHTRIHTHTHAYTHSRTKTERPGNNVAHQAQNNKDLRKSKIRGP